MITKLNPAVVNDKWGGVLYLELGDTKPDNFEDIRSKLLEHINRQKYYSITVHDISWNLELNSPELIYSDGGNTVIMRQISFDDNFLLTIIEYYFYGDGNYVRRARNIDTVNTVSGKVDTVSGKVDVLASTKQDVLTAGKGIVIDDNNTISINLDTDIFKVVPALPEAPVSGDENKIHLVLSSSSEEGNTYDEYIWVNNYWERIGSFRPSVDLSGYAEKSYVDSQIDGEAVARTEADTELQTQINNKQEALTLTVKDNGNIVLANIQGQSKEFMPATPSGDPMHYAYVAAGAIYNDTGADIVKTAPWADLADDDADKTVVHKAGYWYLNGLGDLTNNDMLNIMQTNRVLSRALYAGASYKYRTNLSFEDDKAFLYNGVSDVAELLRANGSIEVLRLPKSNSFPFAPKNVGGLCYYAKKIIHICNILRARSILTFERAFECSTLRTIKIQELKCDVSFSKALGLTLKSVLYMINNEEATSPITITLHADVYNRCMANADILAALETHTNISLASA